MPRIVDIQGGGRRPVRQVKPGQPPGRGGSTNGKGQPPFIPTPAQRVRVMTLVAAGFTRDTVALAMGIPPSTLDLHFAWELTNGKALTDVKILGGIVEQAIEGDKTMRIFYAKSRAGWREAGARDAEAVALFSINISNRASDAAPEISVIARPIHSLPEPEEEP